MAKIVDKPKYHADIEAKLKSNENIKRRKLRVEPIVVVTSESEDEIDDGDSQGTLDDKKRRQYMLKNRATKDLQKQPRNWAEVD